jgi:ADP-ribosyl-[dinitrogen reductase] hydrolase
MGTSSGHLAELPTGYKAHLPDVRQRARASLLGLAVGDALGATVEFMTAGEIKAKYGVHRKLIGGGWLRLAPGQVTDDTQMSLCIARSVVAVGYSPEDIARRFVTWYQSKPPDVGNTCRRGIARFINQGTVHGAPNEGDAGNGAVMRMAPVAVAALADERLLEEMTIGQAHITHNHALSDGASLLVGRLIQLALIGHGMDRLQRQASATVASFPSFRFAPYHGMATAYVVDTVQTVLHFLFSTSSFEECVVATVNQGGDADTTGAIVGAIAGAYYGWGSIPREWLRKLDPQVRDELVELADKLVDHSPLAHGQPVTVFPPDKGQGDALG